MINSKQYAQFLSMVRKSQCKAKISFNSKKEPYVFQDEQTLITAFEEAVIDFEECLEKVVTHEIFNQIKDNSNIKTFGKKAAKFWKKGSNAFQNRRAFCEWRISAWLNSPCHILPRELMTHLYFSTDISIYYYTAGLPYSAILQVLKTIATREIEPTITMKEARMAAAYVQRHQAQLLKNQDIVMKFAKQQGMIKDDANIYRFTQMTHILKATISPDLLEYIQETAKYNTKNIEARRIISEMIKNNNAIGNKPPVSALAEIADIFNPDLISNDTVERYVKAVKKHPTYFQNYYFKNYRKSKIKTDEFCGADSDEN
ncbi:hypothetical protein [Neisseria wadsworthii]|uniref:hypothetical protein n=1 Tax=Neisseria wadsworthii TaxID=607711 RepID=UPI000D31730E|nr:hypothetical protein [Neisseria wadsworthii]